MGSRKARAPEPTRYSLGTSQGAKKRERWLGEARHGAPGSGG